MVPASNDDDHRSQGVPAGVRDRPWSAGAATHVWERACLWSNRGSWRGVLELDHLLDSGYDEHDGQGQAAGCGAGRL